MQVIFTEVQDGQAYYCATRRGVSYVASQCGDQWWVSSRRLALGRFNTGGGKYYATLQELSAGCKAFAGLDLLLAESVPA